MHKRGQEAFSLIAFAVIALVALGTMVFSFTSSPTGAASRLVVYKTPPAPLAPVSGDLTVAGNIKAGGPIQSGNSIIIDGVSHKIVSTSKLDINPAGYFRVKTGNPDEAIALLGKVGIDTTTPQAKLDVVGDAHIYTPEDAAFIPTIDLSVPRGIKTGKILVSGGDAAVWGGDVTVLTEGKGVILKAADGPNCYRVTVNDAGALSTASVECPSY